MNEVPLKYQITEYDCGSTAVINAINYVVPFSDIPASFLKVIYGVCLNECNQTGMIGREGTSPEAMKYLAQWINRYSQKTGFPLHCDCYEEFSFQKNSPLLNMLRKGNCAIVVMCLLWDEHYITLTDADDEYIYLFDAYFWNKDYGDENIIRIDFPYKANRKLPIGFMEETKGKFYNLSDVKKKIAVVFKWK